MKDAEQSSQNLIRGQRHPYAVHALIYLASFEIKIPIFQLTAESWQKKRLDDFTMNEGFFVIKFPMY